MYFYKYIYYLFLYLLNQDGQIGALDVEMLAVHKFLCMMKGHKSLIKHTNRVHLSFQFQTSIQTTKQLSHPMFLAKASKIWVQ